MKKNDNSVIDIYEGKISVEERLMLLLTGVLCFPVGFALYFYFKDKNNYKYHVHFARVGSWTGFVCFLLILISLLMFTLAKCLQF